MEESMDKLDSELDEFYVMQITELLLREDLLENEIQFWERKRKALRKSK
jgi:hypothetical protein